MRPGRAGRRTARRTSFPEGSRAGTGDSSCRLTTSPALKSLTGAATIAPARRSGQSAEIRAGALSALPRPRLSCMFRDTHRITGCWASRPGVLKEGDLMADQVPLPTRARAVSRRAFLRAAGVAGGIAVSGARPRGPASAQDAGVQADPSAKRGGTLRYGVHTAPAHFDVHQSGTVANIGAQSPMYDTLLRRSPKDGQTVVPDLAWKWEISPDGKKYTFHPRKGVKFHDGADFTDDDVKATYDRIVHPPKGVVIPRTPLFATVGDIVVVDPHKIEFRLTEPRPKAFMLGAFASGWNIIVRKKTLDDNRAISARS